MSQEFQDEDSRGIGPFRAFFLLAPGKGHNRWNAAQIQVARNRKGPGRFARRTGSIIRPLIEIERAEIEKFLKARKLAFVTDSSNLKTDYLRNRIRLELMPLLEEHQPRLARLLGQTAEILRNEDEYLEQIAEAWAGRDVERSPRHALNIPISPLLDLPLALRRRVIRNVIGKVKKDLRRKGFLR